MNRPTYTDPQTAWQAALSELSLQMTAATYSQWLNGTTIHHTDGQNWTILVPNDYAADWLTHRLNDTITRTLNNVTGQNITLTYTTGRPKKQQQPDQDQLTLHQQQPEAHDPPPPPFPGFEPIKSNFVRVPMQYFEIVIPAGPYIVAAFVAQVIRHTRGWIVDWNTGETRRWWDAQHHEIAAVCGFHPRHVIRAVKDSRRLGYIIRGGKPRAYRYRLRVYNEPIDHPDDHEPEEEEDHPVDKPVDNS